MKVCFKCRRKKPLSSFYKHGRMADGRLGKCKSCTKKDVSENYAKNREYYAAYERARFQNPERKKYAIEIQKKRRKIYPGKYRASTAVGNAIRDGRLTRGVCEVCGVEKVQAHHDDYRKPLSVRWLCRKHHLEHHGRTFYG